MKAGKTPYEIRLDLLTLAHQILTQKAEAKANADFDATADAPNLVTTSPTTEEVIAEATKLNGFVSSGN